MPWLKVLHKLVHVLLVLCGFLFGMERIVSKARIGRFLAGVSTIISEARNVLIRRFRTRYVIYKLVIAVMLLIELYNRQTLMSIEFATLSIFVILKDPSLKWIFGRFTLLLFNTGFLWLLDFHLLSIQNLLNGLYRLADVLLCF